MEVQTVFYLILSFVILDFVIENILSFLNASKRSAKIPKELEGIYNEDEYEKSQAYEKTKHNFSRFSSIFSFCIILLLLFFDGFAFIDTQVSVYDFNPVITSLLFFLILGIGSEIIGLPFSVYHTFVIEEKFGFNKTSTKTFVLDKIKSWILVILLGGGILAIVIWLYTILNENFWIYVWMVLTVFMIVMTMLYSNVIVPLFNKQTPLEEGELRTEIEKFALKAGFKLKNIFVIDGSKRSSKANAYFSGLGPKKRIVLYDTLISNHSTGELVAVLAHEIGHYKKKHTLVGIFSSVIQTGVMLYVFSLLVNSEVLSAALGANKPSFHIGLLAFGLLYSPISTLLGILMNSISRMNEYTADRFAASFDYGVQLIEALKNLSKNNLSNLTPHKAYVFFHYSHPPLLQRIRALKKFMN